MRSINKFTCYFLASVSLVFSAFAQENNPVVGKSKITIDNKSYDFGTVSEGTKVEKEFIIKNEGNVNLNIIRVVAGCGCTIASAAANIVAPQQSTSLKVSFDTNGQTGSQVKAVRVYSDDLDNPISTLEIKGIVASDIKAEPRNLFFAPIVRGVEGQKASQEVRVKVNEHSGLKIYSIETFSKFISLEEKNVGEFERTIVVSVDTNMPVGEFRDKIIVNVTGKRQTSINIPVFVPVRGKLQLDPPVLSLGIISGDKPIVRRVKLENFDSKPYNISDVKSNIEYVTGKIAPIKQGQSYWLDIQVDPTKTTRDLRAEVKIVGDPSNENKESITLSVFGLTPPKS
jgi:Protein of unknown function (DUF1573)